MNQKKKLGPNGCLILAIGLIGIVVVAIIISFTQPPDFTLPPTCKKLKQVEYDFTRWEEFQWSHMEMTDLDYQFAVHDGDSGRLRRYCEG